MYFEKTPNFLSKEEFVNLYNEAFKKNFVFDPLKTISTDELNKFINMVIGTILLYHELHNIKKINTVKSIDNKILYFWFYSPISFRDFVLFGKTGPFIKVDYHEQHYTYKAREIYNGSSLVKKYIIEGERPEMEKNAYVILKSKVLDPMFTKYSAYGISPKISLSDIGSCKWTTSIGWSGIEYNKLKATDIKGKTHTIPSYFIKCLIAKELKEFGKIYNYVKNYINLYP